LIRAILKLEMARKPQFQKTVFPNGLTVLSERHPEFRSLSVGVWVKVGTRHENAKEVGVSHFLEHMVFKGTKKRTALDIAREVDRVGGDFNAFTSRENTCFHVLLLDRDIGLGLDILSDVILNSTFEAEELERERKVILQEISMVDESPEELAHDLFYELFYPNHGIGRAILGTEKSINALKRSEVLKYFYTHYRPDQIVISVAGNVTHQAVLKKMAPLIKKKWPGRPAKFPKPTEDSFKAPKSCAGRWWVDRNTEQCHVVWTVPGPTYTSKDRFAAFLLNVYLGGGMSSTLFQEIREKNGLAYTVYSSLAPYTDTGIFSIYAATNASQVPLCLKLVEECVNHVKAKPLSKKELETIKDNLKGTILLSSDSAESRMSSIARNEMVFGRYVSVEEVCKEVDAVTPADLQRLANKLFADDERSILVLGPKPSQTVLKKMGFTQVKR
jgi:predicted Zn-dependent peptidase